MNIDDDTLRTGSDRISYGGTTPPAKRGSRGTILLLALAIAFAGGIAATIFGYPAAQRWWTGEPTERGRAVDEEDRVLLGDTAAPPPATGPVTVRSMDVATLEARIAAVTAQLDAVSAQAAAAGGNAARAEGLLIAIAVRRALDRGTPLGYLEGELRLRFGESQPRAVATIINAAADPVTLADLRANLDRVAPDLYGPASRGNWWEATKRELASLIVIRKASAPSPVPEQAIERAKLLISGGRVGDALTEIERLPAHQKADHWLQQARQFNEARRALDVIEAAAILEPRDVSAQRTGQTGMQVAPPPPAAAPAPPPTGETPAP